ncbi:hypothetical protein PUNSTDRAFT_136548 [Punctularia strigosozonata HHB-11173 SS5]|uniref:uncharacterized protein n=1 Tax=Punctularia strigosozonata (strain HHB-11173) TaxID=741275 RepID=UPI0004417048|nr:uncharacterized protein PUNSTDRAFT_136548 [Punctularia strigosozonata HHB-11173 SS5]EIN06710.1 hypothetical protein PUNSTDRAFT_136548 [Punctularia strigosozonata HHB-11173 SS5]
MSLKIGHQLDTQAPDLLTFRLRTTGAITYVVSPRNYQHAIETAFDAFADSLLGVSPDRVSLSVQAFVGQANESRSIRIFPNAWDALVRTLHRFEIINVDIVPPLAPPAYPAERDSSPANPSSSSAICDDKGSNAGSSRASAWMKKKFSR